MTKHSIYRVFFSLAGPGHAQKLYGEIFVLQEFSLAEKTHVCTGKQNNIKIQ